MCDQEASALIFASASCCMVMLSLSLDSRRSVIAITPGRTKRGWIKVGTIRYRRRGLIIITPGRGWIEVCNARKQTIDSRRSVIVITYRCRDFISITPDRALKKLMSDDTKETAVW